MRVMAVIPAHDEILTIREVVAGTLARLDDVLVIDDGSTDGTAEAAAGAGARVVRNPDNLGKGARLAQGLDLAAEAGFDAVLTLDADDQHDPAAIPGFLAAALANPGAIVTGDRSADMGRMPGLRRNGIRFGNFFIGWACGQRIRDAQCGMRLYPVAVWRRLALPPSRMRGFLFETAILMHGAEAGAGIVHVPVEARYEGFVRRPSHFRPVRDFLRLFGMVTAFLAGRGFRPRGLLVATGLSSARNYPHREGKRPHG